ncbi:MAG: hypothetical protein H7287_02335, partial [Thermoleophilia bacterium]|nr:hypothetical protein [Thermoleophilia bacterium]
MPRPRSPRPAALVIIASLAVIGVAVGGYALAGSHQVLPGMRGCKLIRNVPAQSGCVVSELQGVLKAYPGRAGLRAVDALAQHDPLVQSQCHLAMHPIGESYGAQQAKAGKLPEP